jgi:hypothetical protein
MDDWSNIYRTYSGFPLRSGRIIGRLAHWARRHGFDIDRCTIDFNASAAQIHVELLKGGLHVGRLTERFPQ